MLFERLGRLLPALVPMAITLLAATAEAALDPITIDFAPVIDELDPRAMFVACPRTFHDVPPVAELKTPPEGIVMKPGPHLRVIGLTSAYVEQMNIQLDPTWFAIVWYGITLIKPFAAGYADGTEFGTKYAADHPVIVILHAPSVILKKPSVAIALFTGIARIRLFPETTLPFHVINPPPVVTQLAFMVLESAAPSVWRFRVL